VVIVRHAYNHTVAAEVKLRRRIGPLISQIVLVVLGLMFVFSCMLLSQIF